MQVRIGNKTLDFPDSINAGDLANGSLWDKLRQISVAFETVWFALNDDAYAVKDNPHMWNNRYQAFRWFRQDVGASHHYGQDRNNVTEVESERQSQTTGFKYNSFKRLIDDIEEDFKAGSSFSTAGQTWRYQDVRISPELKADWMQIYRQNTINMINYFNNTYWGWFDGNGWCVRSCQVSCQQSCQLACQSCQHNTCHNQHCGI